MITLFEFIFGVVILGIVCGIAYQSVLAIRDYQRAIAQAVGQGDATDTAPIELQARLATSTSDSLKYSPAPVSPDDLSTESDAVNNRMRNLDVTEEITNVSTK